MRVSQKIPALLTLVLFLFLCSCEKSESDDRELFPKIMPIDSELIGEWHRSYNRVSDHTWITVYTDSIKFNSNNLGYYRIFKFRDLDSYYTFQYYTEDNTIFLKIDERNEIWTYEIRSDSLFIPGTIPYIR